MATITYTSGLIAPSAIGAVADATSLVVSFGLVTLLAFALIAGATVLRQGPPVGQAGGGPGGATAGSGATDLDEPAQTRP